MGCDIHVHIEVKIKGKWEHYSTCKGMQNYRMFALWAGVRNEYDIKPFVEPRGLPDDITAMTRFDWDRQSVDWHTPSFFTFEEIASLSKRMVEEEIIESKYDLEPMVLGRCYLFGHSIGSHHKYPEDWKKLKELGFEDCRIVFWFDN